MVFANEVIDAPLDREQLSERWRALCADPSFEDLAAKIELTEWGEILMSPGSKTHGLSAAHIADLLRKVLGGHVMVEVGVATAIGVRAPYLLHHVRTHENRAAQPARLRRQCLGAA